VATSSDKPASNPTRELAAIMFSDVVGYTAIMGRGIVRIEHDRPTKLALAGRPIEVVPDFDGT